MEFDNATNLDRNSGVRGTKKMGEAPPVIFKTTKPHIWPQTTCQIWGIANEAVY
jgi:hypothetical protein